MGKYNNYESLLSLQLFNKEINELQIGEIKLLCDYISDYKNPTFKDLIIDGINTGYKITNTGYIYKGSKQMKVYHDKSGYNIIFIRFHDNSGKYDHPYRVHRLVAETFIPNPENKPEVNHINGDKDLNWVGNLEWCTRFENIEHALNNGLMKTKYTPEDVHKVCHYIETGKSIKEIADICNVSKSLVIGILFRGEWKNISSHYNLPKIREYTDKKKIHEICKMLEDGYSPLYISRKTDIKPAVISSIKNGRTWITISSKYNIPGLKKLDKEIKEKLSDQIIQLFDEGIFETSKILSQLNLDNHPKRNSYVKYISKLRIKFKQV